MSKIAFINPNLDFESIYGSLSEERSQLPPLGLCYLAATARSAGYEVRVIDAPVLGMTNERAARLAVEWGASCVGITATTDTVFQAADIADVIKSVSRGTVVLIGGAHVTAVPLGTLEKFPSFDIGVIGEGESTIKDLLETLEAKRPLEGVKGISYRTGDGIKRTERRDFIQDIDSLPYPGWEFLPELPKNYRPVVINYKNLPSTSLVTSRGCPGKCAFCDTKVFGSKYRVHSAGYVLDMISHLKEKYGIKDICFYDDVFTVFKKRLDDICEGLRQRRYGISWSCQARVNSVDFSTMKKMKDAGCWKISFGIESGSDQILRLMNKHIVKDQSMKVLHEARRAGLEAEGYFILGFFGETKKTLDETKGFIRKAPLDTIILSCFLPYPGSPAYPHLKEYGDFNEDWRDMNAFDEPKFIPYGLTKEDIVRAKNEIYRNFYFRPGVFARYAVKMAMNPPKALKMVRSSFSLAKFIFKK